MAQDFDKEEADKLIAFFRRQGFSSSSQISNYIVNHDLKTTWPNITGYVTMEHRYGGTWDFDGGSSPSCFRYICGKLGLDDNESDSHVVGFDSYANRRSRNNPSKSLEEELRNYRTCKSREESVPRYCVFSDAVLHAIVADKPTLRTSLLKIRGFGPAKYEKYGADIIRIVKKCR